MHQVELNISQHPAGADGLRRTARPPRPRTRSRAKYYPSTALVLPKHCASTAEALPKHCPGTAEALSWTSSSKP